MKILVIISDYLYKCPVCPHEIVLKHNAFMCHYKRYHEGFPPGYESLPKLQCDQCSEQFLLKKQLAYHKEKVHPAEGDFPLNFYCDRCDEPDGKHDYKSPNMLIQHYRNIHYCFPPIFEDKVKFICKQCPNIYITQMDLKQHEYYHKDKKLGKNVVSRVACQYCGKTFSGKEKLKDHIIVIHEDSCQFQCEICSKKMPSAGKLKSHIGQVHTKVTCEVCKEVLYNAFYLRKHKATMHGIIPQNSFRCHICSMIFKQETSLKKHLASKHAQWDAFSQK